MPTLADQIEQLRVKLGAVSPHEEQLVQSLASEVAARDEHLLAMLDALLADHAMRREMLRDRLETLAGRLGFVPGRRAPPIEERYSRRPEAIAADEHFAGPTYPPNGLFRPVNTQPI